jgi:hypothetical protein
MATENSALGIRTAKSKKRRRYDLERLIDGITEENQHSEIDWGRPPAMKPGNPDAGDLLDGVRETISILTEIA